MVNLLYRKALVLPPASLTSGMSAHPSVLLFDICKIAGVIFISFHCCLLLWVLRYPDAFRAPISLEKCRQYDNTRN